MSTLISIFFIFFLNIFILFLILLILLFSKNNIVVLDQLLKNILNPLYYSKLINRVFFDFVVI